MILKSLVLHKSSSGWWQGDFPYLFSQGWPSRYLIVGRHTESLDHRKKDIVLLLSTREHAIILSLFFCDTKNHPVIGGTKVLSSGKSQVFDSYKLSACRMALKLSWQVALRRPSCDTGQHLCCCHCRLSESFQVFWSQPSWEFSFSSMGRRSERRTSRWEAFFNSL